MTKITVLSLVAAMVATPLALAEGSRDDAERALGTAADYGISEFRSIEFDDDGHKDVEIEGWMDDWYVDLELDPAGNIEREHRRKFEGERYGLSRAEVADYLNAATAEGLVWLDELEVRRGGYVEVEGEDERGRELELDFRKGNLTPVRVERDD